MRTDSPTCDIEWLNILLSWVSCEHFPVKLGERVPDVDISADTMFVARVPSYGTCDAGSGFWKKLRHDILSTCEHCTFSEKTENPNPCSRLMSMTFDSGTFRFCGREVIHHSDFSVSIRCQDTTEKIEPVRYDPEVRKQTDLARDHENVQLRSVVGSLAWVARQCRPQLSYGVEKLQSVCGTATLDDLRFAKKLLQEAEESSEDELFFESGLTWNKAEMLTNTDASFGNESNFRRQKRTDDFSLDLIRLTKNGMGCI